MYVHDPVGRRIAKKLDGVITEKYLWAGMTQLLAVYDGTDSLRMRFEYAGGRLPLAMVKDGVRYYLLFDQVGTLRAVANEAGALVKRVDYDSFGNILTDTAPTFTVPMGFAGGLHDRDTGLIRFGYRDYDPDTGRWTAKDPIGFAGGDTDLYGYCVSDPIDLIDPTGESWVDDALYYGAQISAGFGDSLTFGATNLARQCIFGGNQVVNKCSGAYIVGETLEILAEAGLTGGSSLLRRVAAKASREATYASARQITSKLPRLSEGGMWHHRAPLFGHYGGFSTPFPTGGLPNWLHSNRLNLRWVQGLPEHTRLHRRTRVEEGVYRQLINREMTATRAGIDAGTTLCACE